MALPWEPLPSQSGYFLMADIRKCKPLIPDRFLDSHKPDDLNLPRYPLTMSNGKVPLDLAFCRWMGSENGVTMMPGSFFYHPKSPFLNDSYARLAICKDLPSVKLACQALRKVAAKH